jgi:hypothetical protein
MTKLERLAYWKKVCGDIGPETWVNEEDDLFAFFQRFRPYGRDVAKVFDGVYRGEEILVRLLRFYHHTTESADDAYFVVRNPVVATAAQLLEAVTQYLDKVRQMAEASETVELMGLLDALQIEVEKKNAPPHSALPEPNLALLNDTVTDWFLELDPETSEALLLKEAFYSMTCDYQLSWYVLWPLYQGSTRIQDPFDPYFRLWIYGAVLRFTNEELLTVYCPSVFQGC